MKKVLLSSFALVLIALTSWAIATTTAAPMKAASVTNPVDETSKIVNPSFDEGTNGWTVNTGKIEVKGTSANPVVTAYNYQVNISQHITGLTPGTYILKVQACSRYKDGSAGISDYEKKVENGTAIPNEAYIFANGQEKKIKNIFEEGYDYDFAKESNQTAATVTLSSGLQIPYNSTNFSRAFGEFGMYENELEFTVAENGAATIGIKNELSTSQYTPYIAYDNFRLYRIADAENPGQTEDPETEEPEQPGETTGPVELYDLHAPAGTLVPICMPYAVKSEYFGQVYQIGSIQDGVATIVPVNEVATGVPCVVKSKGSSSITSATTNYYTRPTTFSLWDNTVMQATSNFTGFTWTATDIYDNKINASDLTFVEGDLTNFEFTASIENNAAARYWAQHPDYKAEDESCIKNYYQLPVYNSATRRDKPNPILVPVYTSTSSQTVTYWRKADKSDKKTVSVSAGKNVAEIYDDNFIPGTVYSYESTYKGAKGKFTVGGTLRMMNIGTNVVNMRDLGGKVGKDGKYVKYGKLYRSAEFKGSTYNINSTEKAALVALGISAELDLRNTDGGTERAWIPNLVNNDNYFYAKNSTIIANGPGRMYESSTINLLKNEFTFLVANLRKGRSVQFHCRIGADRTGLFAFLTLGLLGVSEADILRDYETTSYSSAGLRTKEDGDGDSSASNYKAKVPTFRATASTFVGAFEKYFLETLKVSQTDIDDFRNIMLGDTPLPSDVEAEELAKQEAAKEAKKTEINSLVAAIKTKVAELKNGVGTNPGQYTLDDPNGAIPAAEAEVSTAEALIANAATLEGLTEEVTKLTACLEALNGVTKTLIPEKEDEDQVAANTFKADNAAILAKTTENVESADLTAINKALEDYNKLSDKAKAKLTAEKELLDALKIAAEEAAQVQAAVEKFKTENAEILKETVETVESNDLTAINKALEDYNKLSDKAKESLTKEKELLDALKAAAEEAAQVQAAVNTFKADNAEILKKSVETVLSTDLTAINKALEDYNKLSDKAKESLTKEKELLDALKIAAEEAAQVQAAVEKFKTENAEILKKTVETVESNDLTAINKALEDYGKLSDKAKESLTNEKALLDQLKTAAENKQTEEEQAAQLQAEINKFKTDNAEILEETVETVESNDLGAINKALEDYGKLSDKAKTALATEKELLDNLLKAANDKKAAEEEAAKVQAEVNKFKDDNSAILAKTTESVEYDDLVDIENALADYNNLSDKAKAELTTEKELLDALKTAAEEKKPQEGEDPEVIKAKKEQVAGLIEEVNAKVAKLKRYNVGTGWGQFTCSDPQAITTAETTANEAKDLIKGNPTIAKLDAAINALNASSAALDKVKMTLNMPKYFLIQSGWGKYITLWPGTNKRYAMSKTDEEEQLGDNPDWIMYDVTTNYSIFTIRNGNIVQVIEDDEFYPGFGFVVEGDDVAPLNMNSKSYNDPAEFTPAAEAADDDALNIKVGNFVISEQGISVKAVKEGNTLNYSNFKILDRATTPIVAGINDIKADVQAGNVFNIAGQRVSDDYQGIIIRDGKRILVK